VATGEDPAKDGVRVTAAIEPAFEIGDEGVAGGDSWLQYDGEQDTEAVAEELTDILLRHCVPEDIIDHMVSCATVMGYDDISVALVDTIEHLFSFNPLPNTSYHKPIIMVGPPGAGKTLATAKLATRSVINGLSVGVVSTDTIRAGGVEQLKAFTNLLRIKLAKAHDAKDLRSISRDLIAEKDQVIIDTSGLNPFDTSDVRVLAKLIAATEARPILVMPAGMDTDEAGEMARVFATIGAAEILPTRVDIARRLGGILSAAHQGGLTFTDVSNTSENARSERPQHGSGHKRSGTRR